MKGAWRVALSPVIGLGTIQLPSWYGIRARLIWEVIRSALAGELLENYIGKSNRGLDS